MLGLKQSLAIGKKRTASGGIVDAPVTDGLIGYWRGGEGITTDTSGGTTTVSQWDNIASDRGGEASQTWHMTQSTKADQPTYDATNEVLNWAGGSDKQILTFDATKIDYNTTWSVVVLLDISDINNGILFGHASAVQGKMTFYNSQDGGAVRFQGTSVFYPPHDSSASPLENANFNIIGQTYAASPSDATGMGYISNQYLFLASNSAHNNPAINSGNPYFGSPSSKPYSRFGGYGGQSSSFDAMDIKEVMIFNKQLNQTEVTAIHSYMNGIVTLNVLPDGLDYFGSE